ncbi:MAG TPA: succinate dehydrogenase cytochrome b subunit [Planctomycetota bacterium]|nr:succinate dehydrogenase cytochrome b subunit [Planctomycetota bacterium]
MNWLLRSLQSSIGRKLLVALTGVALLGFVIAHLLGNLQVFAGPDRLNGYAEGLEHLGPLLWAARLGLIVMAVAHVALTLKLAAENRAARPVAYAARGRVQSTASARSMLLTGLMVLAFVLYHLAHFTWGVAHPEFSGRLDSQGRRDVYSMVVASFQQWPIVAAYAVAMILLGLHIRHGASSIFQTFGWNHPKYNPFLHAVGPVLALLIVAGNLAIPFACLAGLVKLPPGVTF